MEKNIPSSKVIKACEHCKKNFISYRSNKRRYCSHTCANIDSGPIRKRRVIIECEVCRKEFDVTKGAFKVRKKIRFCSIKCRDVGMKQLDKWKIMTCKECKKQFSILKVRKNRKYCNIICSKKGFKKNPYTKRKGYWYENGYKVLYAKNGNGIKEHIKMMEEYIGRKLRKNEVVHHINHNKLDNRIENLKLMTRSEHSILHRKEDKNNGIKLFWGRD